MMNELAKGELDMDASVFSLWADDPENPLELRLSVTAPEGMYQGVPLVFEIHVPDKEDCMYPNNQPEVNLVDGSKILHPNINYEGKCCLGYRKENPWKATYGLKTVALSIVSVLMMPNANNAQDGCGEWAKTMRESEGKFKAEVERALKGGTVYSKKWPSKDDLAKLAKSVGAPSPKARFLGGKGKK